MNVTEQRYRAVLEVRAGSPVTDVADRFGVSRQAVHRWLRWYAEEGLDGLTDRSHRPHAHPWQVAPEMEAASASCAVAIRGGGNGGCTMSWVAAVAPARFRR